MDAARARDEIFGDALACEEARPSGFHPAAPDPMDMRAACLRSEGLLRALAVVEDSRGIEDNEEYDPANAAHHRLEAKVDLLTALMARLVRSQEPSDPIRTVRWSALGVCLPTDTARSPGTTGTFRIQPSDWLPESLELPATVLASVDDPADPRLWLRFGPLTPALESALQRHLFRVHRREVAEARRPR
ncbi:PilZ domain-containing protein [Lysobacter sp. A3-1-A15]|uniref:PilZ domain-containing protein n=1 Tax=Novilysobacter viscosus TaxID=3098602 RepID=UPI002EDA6D53